jgi:RimJ/RimL family protein N-acetyltransferase
MTVDERAQVSPDWLARVRLAAADDPWILGFALVHRITSVVIGTCGFKGPPDDDGTVEIAYGVAPDHQGHGYATEAAAALVAYAFNSGQVRRVRAHTLAAANASARVLAKCGFRQVGEVIDPEDGPVWRWEKGRRIMNPFTGKWVANIEKSRQHENHQFKSATLTFEEFADAVSLTHTGVNHAGKQESGATVLYPDGPEHEVSPQAPGVVAVTRWIGTHTLESEARKDGRVVGKGTYAVSDDGQVLTATVGGTDASGKHFEQVIVFDRV